MELETKLAPRAAQVLGRVMRYLNVPSMRGEFEKVYPTNMDQRQTGT